MISPTYAEQDKGLPPQLPDTMPRLHYWMWQAMLRGMAGKGVNLTRDDYLWLHDASEQARKEILP